MINKKEDRMIRQELAESFFKKACLYGRATKVRNIKCVNQVRSFKLEIEGDLVEADKVIFFNMDNYDKGRQQIKVWGKMQASSLGIHFFVFEGIYDIGREEGVFYFHD